MLVLSRTIGQVLVVVVGDVVVKIKIAEARNGKVRVAFDAPKEAVIYREEIYERLLGELAETVALQVQQERDSLRPDSADVPAIAETIGRKDVSVSEA